MANPKLGICARKWRRADQHQGASFRTHMKNCLKGSGRSKVRKGGVKRRAGSTCTRECNQKVKNRIAAGDRTPKATMKKVCMRKCAERPASVAAVIASAPPPIKRDVAALCARYSSDAAVRARCIAGEVGPGRLVAKLAGSSPSTGPFVRTVQYRLAKRAAKFMRKRRGAIRRAALKSKQSAGMRFVLRSPFGSGRKTIGRGR